MDLTLGLRGHDSASVRPGHCLLNWKAMNIWPHIAPEWLFQSLVCSNPWPPLKSSFKVCTAKILGVPTWLSGKEPTCQCRRCSRCGFSSWVRKIPWSRKWNPTPFLPGKFHKQRSLVGYSPWSCKELDTAEHAHPNLNIALTALQADLISSPTLLSTQFNYV